MGISNKEGYINYPSAGHKQVFPQIFQLILGDEGPDLQRIHQGDGVGLKGCPAMTTLVMDSYNTAEIYGLSKMGTYFIPSVQILRTQF
jgi:hypothetical protein